VDKLRQAAELALQYFENAHGLEDTEVAIKEALRQALAQPVDAVNISQERVDETAKGEHEPVAWIGKGRCQQLQEGESVTTTLTSHKAFLDDVPLYAAPPKREWVGLSDEEMRELTQKAVDDGMIRTVTDFEYIRSIEAKLREKNA
jgi:hypothetical protein